MFSDFKIEHRTIYKGDGGALNEDPLGRDAFFAIIIRVIMK